MKNGKEKQKFIEDIVNEFLTKELTILESYYFLFIRFFERGVARVDGKIKEVSIPVEITFSCYRTIIEKLIREKRIESKMDFVKGVSKKKIYLIKQKTKEDGRK